MEARTTEALKSARLLEHAHPLRELGCITDEDLREIGEADLYYIRMLRVQKRRFQEVFFAVHGERMISK